MVDIHLIRLYGFTGPDAFRGVDCGIDAPFRIILPEQKVQNLAQRMLSRIQ